MREDGRRGSQGLFSRLLGGPDAPELPPDLSGPCALLASRYRGSIAPQFSQLSPGLAPASPPEGDLGEMWGGGWGGGSAAIPRRSSAVDCPTQPIRISQLEGSPPRRRDLVERSASPPLNRHKRNSLVAALADSRDSLLCQMGEREGLAMARRPPPYADRLSAPVGLQSPAYVAPVNHRPQRRSQDEKTTPTFARNEFGTRSMYAPNPLYQCPEESLRPAAAPRRPSPLPPPPVPKTVRFAGAASPGSRNPLSPTSHLSPARMASLRQHASVINPASQRPPPPTAWLTPSGQRRAAGAQGRRAKGPGPAPLAREEDTATLKRSLTLGSLVHQPPKAADSHNQSSHNISSPAKPSPPRPRVVTGTPGTPTRHGSQDSTPRSPFEGKRNSKLRSSCNQPIYSIHQVLRSADLLRRQSESGMESSWLLPPPWSPVEEELAGEWVTAEESEAIRQTAPSVDLAFYPTYVLPARTSTTHYEELVFGEVGESYYSTQEEGGPLTEARNPVLCPPEELSAVQPLDLPARLMRGRPAGRSAAASAEAMRRSRSQPMHHQLLHHQPPTLPHGTPSSHNLSGGGGSDMDSGWQSGGSSSGSGKGAAEEEGRLSFYSTTSATTSDTASSADHQDNTSWGSGGEAKGVLGEAIWDYVTLAPDELALRAGEVVTILDWSHPDLWFGTTSGDRSGWFPATHLRLLANQSLDSGLGSPSSAQSAASSASGEEGRDGQPQGLRASVVQELLTTERDYVGLLRDVVEGFLRQAERRPEMFTPERLIVIFGNLEEIYALHRRFLADLEAACSSADPALAAAFLRHQRGFEVYSDYCNNQPLSCAELGRLYEEPAFRHFFEACRLLRGLPALSLDAFLLTPVQRICKYPLQLAELAKHTPAGHADHGPCQKALQAMKAVARVINERKRRLEHLQSIAVWERGVEGWQGPSLLERNSHLVHSGDLTLRFVPPGATSVAWTKDLVGFLFNNTLVLAKKDLLKRHHLIFKEQVELEGARWHFLSDGKDTELGVSVKNGWRLEVPGRGSWLGTCRSREARKGWEAGVKELPSSLPPPSQHDRRIALAAVNGTAGATAPPTPGLSSGPQRVKKTSSTDMPNSKSVPGKMWQRLKAA